jgi:hypothetical protein
VTHRTAAPCQVEQREASCQRPLRSAKAPTRPEASCQGSRAVLVISVALGLLSIVTLIAAILASRPPR